MSPARMAGTVEGSGPAAPAVRLAVQGTIPAQMVVVIPALRGAIPPVALTVVRVWPDKPSRAVQETARARR